MRVVEATLETWSAEDCGMTVDEAFVVQEVGMVLSGGGLGLVVMALNDHDGLVGVVIPE
jgi:hypothetical protein